MRDPNALHMLMLERVLQRADEFDFLHFHLDYYPFSLFSRQPVGFVTTLHGRLDLPEHQPVFATFSSAPVVSISDPQRRPVPNAGWVRTVYHGLPQQLLTPLPAKPQYLAFLGRISPEKGVERAISIARHSGVPLRIAAKVDREYFDEKIRPAAGERPQVRSGAGAADRLQTRGLSRSAEKGSSIWYLEHECIIFACRRRIQGRMP